MNDSAHEAVTSLLKKMRDRVEYLTKKPIDPDFDNLTHMLETITTAYILPTWRNQWPGMQLTKLQRRALELLASKFGVVFSKELIMNALYFDHPNEPDSAIVDVFICKIRAQLRRVAAPIWVETVWGLGYRLVEMPALEGAKGLQPHGPGGRLGNQNARKYPKPVAS